MKLSNTYDHWETNALSRGLFKEGDKSLFLNYLGKATGRSFIELGPRLEISEKRIVGIMNHYTTIHPLIEILVDHSFLSTKTKREYLIHYRQKRNRLLEAK